MKFCYSSRYFLAQKTATAVAHCCQGNGIIKVNGKPLHLVEPSTLRYKVSNIKIKCYCTNMQVLRQICTIGSVVTLCVQ